MVPFMSAGLRLLSRSWASRPGRTWNHFRLEGRMERDPVCGMELMPGHEEAEAQYQGKTYAFCSANAGTCSSKTLPST